MKNKQNMLPKLYAKDFQSNFTRIPNYLIEQSCLLKPNEFRLLCLIIQRTIHKPDHSCYLTVKQLEDILQLSHTTIHRLKHTLRNLGFIYTRYAKITLILHT